MSTSHACVARAALRVLPLPTLCISLCLALVLALVPAAPARSNAEVAPRETRSVDFEIAQDAITSRDWDTAVEHLLIVTRNEPANADAQNLLGYAYRNQKKYDLAFVHYRKALELDPKHKGAHEYIGQTYLLTGDKAKAREHLAALERICGTSCEEYQDLARALARAQ